MVITVMKRSIESELQKQPQLWIYDVPTNEYLDAHEQALEKSKGSDTNAKLVGTTHKHETVVKGSILYNRLSTTGDRLQKELGWENSRHQ